MFYEGSSRIQTDVIVIILSSRFVGDYLISSSSARTWIEFTWMLQQNFISILCYLYFVCVQDNLKNTVNFVCVQEDPKKYSEFCLCPGWFTELSFIIILFLMKYHSMNLIYFWTDLFNTSNVWKSDPKSQEKSHQATKFKANAAKQNHLSMLVMFWGELKVS